MLLLLIPISKVPEVGKWSQKFSHGQFMQKASAPKPSCWLFLSPLFDMITFLLIFVLSLSSLILRTLWPAWDSTWISNDSPNSDSPANFCWVFLEPDLMMFYYLSDRSFYLPLTVHPSAFVHYLRKIESVANTYYESYRTNLHKYLYII